MWCTVILICTVGVWWSVLDSFTVDASVGWSFLLFVQSARKIPPYSRITKLSRPPSRTKIESPLSWFGSDLNRVHNEWVGGARRYSIFLYTTWRGFYGNLSTAKNLWSTLATSKHYRQITLNRNNTMSRQANWRPFFWWTRYAQFHRRSKYQNTPSHDPHGSTHLKTAVLVNSLLGFRWGRRMKSVLNDQCWRVDVLNKGCKSFFFSLKTFLSQISNVQ